MINRVLHILPSLSAGGIESAIISAYQNIDRKTFQFDFAVLNPNNPIHELTVQKLGGEIFYIAEAGCNSSLLSKALWRVKAIINFTKLLKKNPYDTVHCHDYSRWFFYVLISKIFHVKKIIVHSHNSNTDNNSIFSLNNYICNTLSNKMINNKVGCSIKAYQWLFGNDKRACDCIIYNGVDLKKFNNLKFNKLEMEEKYNINQDNFNIITIGRFSIQKNQLFLIDIFAKLCKHNIQKTNHLHIVGFGNLENEIKEAVKNHNIQDKVIFYPYDTNVPELLSCMNCFVLPSKYEGFPVVLVEAQAMNLPCIVSDKVTTESNAGLCKYIPIENGVDVWVDTLETIINGKLNMTLSLEKINAFDIHFIANQFKELYYE